MTEQNEVVLEGTIEDEEVFKPNMQIYNYFKSPPKEVLSEFNTGRFRGTDIKPQWRIQVLTEVFGPVGFGWRTKTLNKWTETHNDDTKVFVDIILEVKDPNTGRWSFPIEGTGGNTMVRKGYVSDEAYKMAWTDAFSRCCQQLGIGADIYIGYEATKYTEQSNTEDNKQSGQRKTPKHDPWAPTITTPSKKDSEEESIVDTIYNNSRENNIRLLQDNLKSSTQDYINFRRALVGFVKSKNKQTYQNLDDKELVEFLINQLGG